MSQQYKKIDKYTLEKFIGGGQFGQVYRAIEDGTNNIYAVKIVPKKVLNESPKLKEFFISEVNTMKQIKNQNVVKLINYIESSNNCYIVMEFCKDGDLESYLTKNKKRVSLKEKEAVQFLFQLCNGFKGLHEVGVMHRDFKPANVFMKDGKLKIGDLGFAKQNNIAQTYCGTGYYMAPEILKKQKYTNKADIWSLGVCFYEMLFGAYPFEAHNEKMLLQQIEMGNVNFNKNGITISPESKDLLKKMLEINFVKRIQWEDIYQHSVFKQIDKKQGFLFSDGRKIKYNKYIFDALNQSTMRFNAQNFKNRKISSQILNINQNRSPIIEKLIKFLIYKNFKKRFTYLINSNE